MVPWNEKKKSAVSGQLKLTDWHHALLQPYPLRLKTIAVFGKILPGGSDLGVSIPGQTPNGRRSQPFINSAAGIGRIIRNGTVGELQNRKLL